MGIESSTKPLEFQDAESIYLDLFFICITYKAYKNLNQKIYQHRNASSLTDKAGQFQ